MCGNEPLPNSEQNTHGASLASQCNLVQRDRLSRISLRQPKAICGEECLMPSPPYAHLARLHRSISSFFARKRALEVERHRAVRDCLGHLRLVSYFASAGTTMRIVVTQWAKLCASSRLQLKCRRRCSPFHSSVPINDCDVPWNSFELSSPDAAASLIAALERALTDSKETMLVHVWEG